MHILQQSLYMQNIIQLHTQRTRTCSTYMHITFLQYIEALAKENISLCSNSCAHASCICDIEYRKICMSMQNDSILYN